VRASFPGKLPKLIKRSTPRENNDIGRSHIKKEGRVDWALPSFYQNAV